LYASQALLYVMPSAPHTGSYLLVQNAEGLQSVDGDGESDGNTRTGDGGGGGGGEGLRRGEGGGE